MHEILIKIDDIRTVQKIMALMENERRLAEEETELKYGASEKEISDAIKQAEETIRKNVQAEKSENDEEYYKELIYGKRLAKNGTEKAISRAKEMPEMALAEIGLNHPATELVFGFLKEKYDEHNQINKHFEKRSFKTASELLFDAIINKR